MNGNLAQGSQGGKRALCVLTTMVITAGALTVAAHGLDFRRGQRPP